MIATVAVLALGARLLRGRLAHAGHADRVHRPARAALPAAAGALGALRPGAVGRRRDGEDHARPRRRDRHREPADARRIGASRGASTLEGVTFAYGARPGAARHRPRHPGRRLRRARGRVGRRQVDARPAGRPLLRPARGRGARRRQRPARDRPRRTTAASSASCCRTRSCSPAPSPTTCASPRPDASDEQVRETAAADRARPRRRALPEGSTTPCARAARPVGGRAAADLDRPRAARRPAHPDPRRGDLEHRPPDRGADREGARPPAARAHVDRDRPPAGDRAPRRRDRRASTAAASSSAARPS